ncbi:MAG: hypothetical protein WCA19_25515 [Candidatus Acidiferrales bacterium]
MSNASTIRRQISGTQQLTLGALSGTTITTTETVFQLNNNALTLAGGGYIPLSAGVTNLYQGTGAVIWIHAAGNLTGGTASSTTLILKLYQITAANLPQASTVASSTVITASSLIATSATGTLSTSVTAGDFSLDAYVGLDAQGNLDGWFQSQVFASTTGAKTAITAVKGLAGEQDLNFLLSATLGGTETGVVVTLNEFSLNAV